MKEKIQKSEAQAISKMSLDELIAYWTPKYEEHKRVVLKYFEDNKRFKDELSIKQNHKI